MEGLCDVIGTICPYSLTDLVKKNVKLLSASLPVGVSCLKVASKLADCLGWYMPSSSAL